MIYLISPYSHSDKTVEQVRARAAAEALRSLLADNRMVYSPIVHGYGMLRILGLNWDPFTHQVWCDHGLAMLKKADGAVALHLPGFDNSKGVRAELEYCRAHDIRVEHFGPELYPETMRDFSLTLQRGENI